MTRLRLPALQILSHSVVDVRQQFVAGPGIAGPDRPVFRDRQLPVDGQLSQKRTGQADFNEGVAPHGNMSLVVHGKEQQHLGDQHNFLDLPPCEQVIQADVAARLS